MDVDPPSMADATTNGSSISTIHPDIFETHILTRLDVAAIAAASCASSQLYSLTSNETLWTNICSSTWPSTNTPRLRHVISSFPKGPRSFVSDSITNPDIAPYSALNLNRGCRSPKLISAVDMHSQQRHILGRVVETETFDSSPFRIDLLDRKERSVPTGIRHPVNEDMYRELLEGLTLSWILIDPIERRATNLSSHKLVASERLWLSTGEVKVRYAWVFPAGEEGSSLEYVKCEISVTFDATQCAEMHVRQVSLHLEDAYGEYLSGKDSLVILLSGMAGKRVNGVKGREKEGKQRHQVYVKVRREKLISRERQRRVYSRCLSWLLGCSFLFLLGYLFFSILNSMKFLSFF